MIRLGELLRRSGAAQAARLTAPRDNLRVTLTHFVAARDMPNFRALLEQLLDERALITPQQVLQLYNPESPAPLRGRLLAITFDDGLLSSYRAAEEVLRPLNIKAMFFVPTRVLELSSEVDQREFFERKVYLDRGCRPSPERYRTMTAEHLRDLAEEGHMILPHTHNHVRLDSIRSTEDEDRELRRPRLIIEDLLGTAAPAVAFPFGTERVVGPAGYAGVRKHYDMCFTGLSGTNSARTSRYALYRDCVHPYYAAEHVDNVCAGSLDLYYRVKMRRLHARARPLAGR